MKTLLVISLLLSLVEGSLFPGFVGEGGGGSWLIVFFLASLASMMLSNIRFFRRKDVFIDDITIGLVLFATISIFAELITVNLIYFPPSMIGFAATLAATLAALAAVFNLRKLYMISSIAYYIFMFLIVILAFM